MRTLTDNNRNKMDFLESSTPLKLILVSLVSAALFIYPNITMFSMERNYLGESKYEAHLFFFAFRYLYMSGMIFVLLSLNLNRFKSLVIGRRFTYTFLITIGIYLAYVCFSLLLNPKKEWLTGLILFQFFISFLFCSFIGHLSQVYVEKSRREQEIEQLKIESLESRYTALTNQINPHFFFNSLNGLTSVIRKKDKKDALDYVDQLSDVFRYILQSDRKGLVTLGEELEFVKSFLYMMEVRFANKLVFNIDVPGNMRDLKLPVLSLLPLIENVVMHNTIDSEHQMEVKISLTDKMELCVSNPVYPKIIPPDTNGTGLINLENRFMLLVNSKIRIINDGIHYSVYLPLKRESNENINSGR
jgi:hypothetical protein